MSNYYLRNESNPQAIFIVVRMEKKNIPTLYGAVQALSISLLTLLSSEDLRIKTIINNYESGRIRKITKCSWVKIGITQKY